MNEAEILPAYAPDVHSNRNRNTKTFVLLLSMVLFSAAGNVLLDKGMKDIGPLELSTHAAIRNGLVHMAVNGTIWLGILCMVLLLICHMLVLSWADYSFVMPFSAVSFALVPLAGMLWLGESVHAARWTGIALIVFGVVLVSRTPPVTTKLDARPLPPPSS